MPEKIALVTGANKGIGQETARQLGERGAVVLVGARDEVRGKQASAVLADRGITAVPLRVDVRDAACVAEAAAVIERRYGRLDILVNNAGIAGQFTGAPSQAAAGDLREVYETNVFGVVTVTNAMLPLLRRSPAGRIVNMSSHLGSLALNADPASPMAHVNMLAYQSSKTALNALTLAYAKELRDTPIKVNAAHPGVVATDINGHRGQRTPAQGAVIAVRLALLDADGPTGASLSEDGPVPW
ncbi:MULTISPECIES: SDR family oxidoreductase [Streptomyces]|uniref:Dehydrogenase n=1 Tax=Streptomyces venezuelae TaxID=54571 RepID=A0A5P2B468_STRVZ|nr:SDR family oxidoreductase [Streptomyces venezuelae]MYY81686.1 SDR family NAD(P)-dependent oxidoreductase [Streptomyces sp. SID335]MYZ18729.1 SDR family NAD(P)-dependent oxidoreductase [Streptomyces sp. SID337]NDZ85195.1 SDR family oxidoreductase [Streptomyces sp. SID10115]NEA05709.1 SDR family oxidoreductase [Streptomyces sp. SID10116]NEB49810.1 SDR family oxidoreductase [Streptomyces sp. SID339]